MNCELNEVIANETQKNQQEPGATIAVEGICKQFGSRRVLQDVSFTVEAGQGVCLCGVNGAGKSTLLSILARLQPATSGQVRIGGFDGRRETARYRSALGLISHKRMVYDQLTLWENLMFYARLYGLQQPKQRVEELLYQVHLWDYRGDPARILSHGMLQRLTIARALLHDPVVLLADEPFTGLDLTSSRELIGLLQDFKQRGGTIILTTHVINIALECCDRVLVLDRSRIIYDDYLAAVDREAFSRDYLEYARSNT